MPRTNGGPLTPAKTPRRNSSLQDSPFSDYFSDDARSSLNSSAQAPSNETKALLVKMNKLQSQLMRDHSDRGREAISIVGRKLAEIDLELGALHSQTRLPIELDDSGVFMAEDKAERKAAAQTPQHSRGPSCQSCASLDSSVESSRIFDRDDSTLEKYHIERTWYISQIQEALEKLNSVQTELRQRQSEFAALHDRHYTVLEEKEEEIEHLRSENEGLRQDLGFEYSELLFLKLQMKSLEVDVNDLRDESNHVTSPKCSKKNDILSEMDRWRTDSDWQDVEARFKRRRSKYGIPTSPSRAESSSVKSIDVSKEEIDWQLETIRETFREGRGRITSLTIKRTDSSQSVSQSIHADHEPEQQKVQPVTLGGSTGWTVTEDDSMQKDEATTFIRPPYADQCTQTDLLLLDPLDEEEEDKSALLPIYTLKESHQEDEQDEKLVMENGAEEYDEDDEQHDCAILASSTSGTGTNYEDLYQDVEEDDETVLEKPTLLSVSQHKSAWQELWSSLQSLTGIPDDEEEEDDY